MALHSGRLIEPASYAEMTTEGPYGYGYGLRVDQQSGETDLSHSGRVSGFVSETEYFPETRKGIIVLSNKLSHNVSPGAIALTTDPTHLATEAGPAIRSLAGERFVEPAILSRYTGTYRSVAKNEDVSVLIELQGGHLKLTPLTKATSTLIARSDVAFYMKEWDGEAEFHWDPNGNWLLDIFTLSNETVLALQRSPAKE